MKDLREFEEEVTIDDLKTWHEDFGFEFPCGAGHLLKAFSCDGLTVLGDRQ